MPSSSGTTTTVRELIKDSELGLTLLVETPESGNFRAYNRTCNQVNTSYLSQPVNEAEYDSETQACVDLLDPDGPSSFYDHYAPRPTKKLGFGHMGLEEPMVGSSAWGCPDEPPPACWPPPPTRIPMDLLAVPRERGLPMQPCTDGGHAILDEPIARRLVTGVYPRERTA